MKKIFLFIGLCLFTIANVQAQMWFTNLEEAQITAQANDQPIILVFQGSDWCAPCIKLDRTIWSSSEFKEYAEENLVLLQADFPRRKKNKLSEAQTAHNAMLAETYNRQGIFPMVAVLTPEGGLLGQTGYKRMSPDDYIEHLEDMIYEEE